MKTLLKGGPLDGQVVDLKGNVFAHEHLEQVVDFNNKVVEEVCHTYTDMGNKQKHPAKQKGLIRVFNYDTKINYDSNSENYPTPILIKYTENGGGFLDRTPCPGQEDEEWPSYEDSYVDWRPVSFRPEPTTGDKIGFEEARVDYYGSKNPLPDRIHLVWVSYDTGDTFGRTCNLGKPIAAFEKYEEAEVCEAFVEAMSKIDHDYKEEIFRHTKIYPIWEGYFEKFNYVEITRINKKIKHKK